MTPSVEIEGERFFCYADTRDEAGRIKPGLYVRDRELERLIRVDDPIWPHRVQSALALGAEHRRNLIAIGEDGLPHVIETITTAIEFGELGAWHADVILLPHGRRRDAVSIRLPLAA